MATMRNTTFEFEAISFPVALAKVSDRDDVKLDTAGPNGEKCKTVKFEPSQARLAVEKGKSVKLEALPAMADWPDGMWLAVKPVAKDAEQKGVFEGKTGPFKAISKDEIAKIEEETKLEAIKVVGFVPISDVPFERAKAAYYLGPQAGGVGGKQLALFYKALKKARKAAVAKLTLSTRQHLAVIYPHNGGMIVNLLSWARDFKRVEEAQSALDGVQVEEEAKTLDMLGLLIEEFTSDGSLIEEQDDDLIPAKEALVAQALKGKKIKPSTREPQPVATTPDAFQDALRKSVAAAGRKRKTKASRGATSGKARAGSPA